jgi:transposase
MQYAQEIREAVVRSALSGEMRQEAIAKRYGVSRSSVQQWARAARQEGGAGVVQTEKRPQDWSAEEPLDHGLVEPLERRVALTHRIHRPNCAMQRR